MRFWGVRGSIPTPGPNTRRYGGNTPCIEVHCGDQLLIFDMGTGARALGEVCNGCEGPLSASIFISHYHYDHLQGLPFFTPLFDRQNSFVLYGASRHGKGVKELLTGQMIQPYFPVTAESVFLARTEYQTIAEGNVLEIGEATVTALELNHPGGSLAYRVDHRGRSMVYATDVEHEREVDERLVEFARGADVLIHDAMYTEDEYFGRAGPAKAGWGHSTWQSAIQAADRAQVKTLVLFHHEPSRDDEGMERLLRTVRRQRPQTIAAREELLIRL